MRKAALLGSICLLALPTLAWAEGMVNRHPDGSIEVKSDVGDTVIFHKGTLGSLIEDAWAKGGKKPFEGITTAVVTLNAGPRGAISGGMLPWQAAWEELSGAKLEIVLKPFNDLAPVIFNDIFTGTGAYDGFVPPMVFLGDMKDKLVVLNDRMCDPRFPPVFTADECKIADGSKRGLETLMPSMQTLFRWGADWYAVPWDADSHILYYRKDIIDNPKLQAQYKTDTGKELRAPQSQQEMLEMACYFNGKDPLGTGKNLYGFMQPGALNSQLFDWYKDVANAWTSVVGGAKDGFDETFSFNPETMEPLINSPGHVAALEWLKKAYACGPADFASIDLGGHFNRFAQGEAVFAWSAGDIAALSQEKESKIQGRLGVMPIPGSTEIYNARDKKMVQVAPTKPAYNVLGASWSGEVSSLSKNPDATYALFAFLGSGPMRVWNVKWGFDGIDIGRKSDFLPPDGTASIDTYVAGGFDKGDAERVSKAIHDNLAGKPYEYFKLPGAAEYNLALEIAVQQTLTGQLTPQAALDGVAEQWKVITDRLGADSQKEAYALSNGLQ
jgi:multiple sugar transport system substrate-binding protein